LTTQDSKNNKRVHASSGIRKHCILRQM
jgi:hypothetical protein